MGKRKQKEADDSESSSGSDVSFVDVDFEFFDPNPNVDYHAIKRLLGQLFQTDVDGFDLHDLTELILSQPTVGTTVKTDGIESDPYAILSVLNANVHQNHSSIKALISYTLQKSSGSSEFHATLQSILGSPALENNQNHVGIVLCERLINMPVQVIAPMYWMLRDEMKWALDDNEPYRFTHFLFISRTYRLSPGSETDMSSNDPPPSKRRAKAARSQTFHTPSDGVYSFHPEDEYIKQISTHSIDYAYNASQPREKDSFGLDTGGRMTLLEAARWDELVTGLGERYK